MNRNRHWSQIPLLAAECWSLRAPEAKNTSTTAPICSPGAQRARVRAFRRRARAQCDCCPRAPLIRFSTAAAHATRMVYEPAGARARSSRQGSDSVFLTALKHPDITDRDRTTHRPATLHSIAARDTPTCDACCDARHRTTIHTGRAAPTPHARTRAEQCWISGIRAVRTAALPSAMPVISVALRSLTAASAALAIAKERPSFCHRTQRAFGKALRAPEHRVPALPSSKLTFLKRVFRSPRRATARVAPGAIFENCLNTRGLCTAHTRILF